MSPTVWVNAMQVTNTTAGHKKYYRIFVVDNVETRQWGRIGTHGQHRVLKHSSNRVAKRSAEIKISQEISKGYSDLIRKTFGAPPDYNPSIDWLRARWHTVRQDEPEASDQRLFWELA